MNIFAPITPIDRARLGKEIWNTYVDSHPQGWLWHRWEWLDYCLAYSNGKDHSFAVANMDGAIVGLIPCIQEGTQFALGRNPVPQALMHNGMQPFAIHINQRLNTVAAINGVRSSQTMNWLTGPEDIASAIIPPGQINQVNQKDITFKRRIVTLTDLQEVRWGGMRKSYKQFVRKGQEKYMLNRNIEQSEACTLFLKMHQDFYGHCRPQKTYAIQEDLSRQGFGRTYLATNDYGLHEGGLFWYVYKKIAYYASGVYPLDNVAQYLLWESMCELAREGVMYADLGYQGRAKTTKEENIEFFKRGFGGADWPVPCIETTFLNSNEGSA